MEKAQKKRRGIFSQCSIDSYLRLLPSTCSTASLRAVRKNAFFEPSDTQNDPFAKTGSGQTYEKLRKAGRLTQGEGCSYQIPLDDLLGTPDLNWQVAGKKNALVATPFHTKTPSFYQDRLGTNVGKTQEKVTVAFSLVDTCPGTLLPFVSLRIGGEGASKLIAVGKRIFCDAMLY
jgi:hypothetical protein